MSEAVKGGVGTSGERLAPLRGAGVQVDVRRLGRIVTGAAVLTLAVLGVVFTVVGIDKNAQIDRLQHHGVRVAFSVTACLGLLGGSGTNAAGYTCRGTYMLSGHTYAERLPGTALHTPGSVVRAIAVPGDPALVSPVSIVEGEHTSATVFVLPAILLMVLLLLGGALVRRRRRPPDRHPGNGQVGGV